MQNFFGLLLDVATPIAISLFVVLPVVGIGLGVLAAWLILKNVSKKKSEKKLRLIDIKGHSFFGAVNSKLMNPIK